MTVYRRQLKLNAKIHQQDLQLIAANEKIQKANEMKNVFIQNMNQEIPHSIKHDSRFRWLSGNSNTFSSDEIKEISNTIKTNSRPSFKAYQRYVIHRKSWQRQWEPMKSSFSVNECCNHVIDEVKEFANTKSSAGHSQRRRLYMTSDKKMIHQILFNLLHNAVKFTSEGELN